jgi:lysophospholipase L1-like esterase
MKKLKKLISLAAAGALLIGTALISCKTEDESPSSQPETTTQLGQTTPPSGNDEDDTDITGTKVSTVKPVSDANADIQIVMCGDSIMRTYDPADGDETGWGQVLQFYFDTGVYVNNTLSNGGRSSKSFYYEKGRWENVKSILTERRAAGKKTYVFINFGHNDQKYSGNGSTFMNYATYAKENPSGWADVTYTKESNVLDSYDPSTAPDNGTYQDFLQKYIDETKALGGIPVIFSPFVRCDVSGGKVTDKGAHNLTTVYANETAARGDYPAAAKETAEANNVTFVDITQLTRDYVDSAVAAGKEKFVYWPNDNTHVRTLGALKICELAMSKIKEKIPELASHAVTPDARILVDANTIDFGRLYPANNTVKSFKVSAFNVTSGKITIKAPKGYTVSLSENSGFEKTLEINTTASYIGDNIYVKFEPDSVAEYNYNLQVTHSSITPDFGNSPVGCAKDNILLVALTGAGKQQVAGGQDFEVTWPMIDSSNKVSYTATVDPEGVVSPAVAVIGSGLKETTYKNDYVNGKARTRFCNSTSDWAGAKDENTYVEFKLPAGNASVIVNQITLELASSGTGNMRWDILYSTNDDFSSPVTIVQGGAGTAIDQDGATSAKANEVLTAFASDPDMGMNIKGKTLTIRVYPYMKSADPGKGANRMIMFGDVKIYGLVQ